MLTPLLLVLALVAVPAVPAVPAGWLAVPFVAVGGARRRRRRAAGLLLSAGDDLLALSTVPDLPLIVESLTPRGLALFCRALAGIFSKNDEPGPDGMPPPECIPPDLCTVCQNRALLLSIEPLIPRVVRLLAVGPPPRWLCPMPNQPARDAAAPQLGDSWATLGAAAADPPEDQVTILLTEDQIPQVRPPPPAELPWERQPSPCRCRETPV